MTAASSLFVAIAILFSPTVTPSSGHQPFGLQWGSPHSQVPELGNFKYLFGDPEWGKVVYIGKKDIAGMPTELQIEYARKRPATATLIFGPVGIGTTNCFVKYGEILKFLNRKHGHYQSQKKNKDFLIYEMIYVHKCEPVSVDLLEIGTIWKTPGFRVEAWLFGDEGDIFIEIEYSFSPMDGQIKNEVEKGLQKVL